MPVAAPAPMHAPAPSTPSTPLTDGDAPKGNVRGRGTRLRPGWPLTVLFGGYPLWWLIGITELACLIAAVVMGFQLARQRRVIVPRGFGWWLLFLAWVAIGIVVLQVDAPLTVAGANHARYLIWAYRLAWYVGATVVLLYIGNTRASYSTQRLCRTFGWMFVVITLGGVLGTVLPTLDFPSLLELVLPRGISSIGFVKSQIHPTVAQLGNVLGEGTARPSAPFEYANTWGLNFALFLPFFVAGWCHRDAGWRRILAPFVLTVAVIPVVYSLNRGLWVALAAAALFVAVRSAMVGRLRVLGALVAAFVVVLTLVSLTPLATTVEARFTSANSNEGRTNLGLLGLRSMTENSPVIGYGTTRDVQGTFTSIAGGETAQCPLCSPPALGTQGQFSLVTYTQGIGGIVLYLGFFGIQFLRHAKLRYGDVTVGLTVITMHVATLLVYTAVGVAQFAIMAAVALLWRAHQEAATHAVGEGRSSTPPGDATWGRYLGFVRVNSALLLACLLVGGFVGGMAQYLLGSSPVRATVSIIVPPDTPYPDEPSSPTTLDTVARFATAPRVRDAIQTATGVTAPAQQRNLSVTAIANTRILNLTYSADTSATAVAGANAAATSLVDMRERQLRDRDTAKLRSLRERARGLAAAVQTLKDTEDGLAADEPSPTRNLGSLAAARTLVLDEYADVTGEISSITNAEPSAGDVVGAARVHRVMDRWPLMIASAAMIGLVIGVLLGILRRAPSRRLTVHGRTELTTGLPVLAVMDGVPGEVPVMADARGARRPALYLAVTRDPLTCHTAGWLNDINPGSALEGRPTRTGGGGSAGPAPQKVVLLAPRRTRARQVVHLRSSLELAGAEVAGLVVLDPGPGASKRG